jgi:hypothetical protein
MEELTLSQGNPVHLLGKTGRAIGGNFFVVKHERFGTIIPERHYSQTLGHTTNAGHHYIGPVLENVGYGVADFPAPHYSSASVLHALGTKIIANVLPTNPLSGLFVSLGELKSEGIPSLLGVQSWKSRTHLARSAGDEYLNHQFGWLPLVNDLKSFTHSVTNSDELVAQYERNSGRPIRRSVALPIDRSSTTSAGARGIAPDIPQLYPGTSHRNYVRTETFSKRRWFVANFTYYLPPFNPNGSNVARNEQLANYLFGTRPTPEGLWNLTPWSWAADWVGNFGSVLHNVSAFQSDGLVMRYGYIMEEGIHEVNYTHPEVQFISYPGKMGVSQTLRTTVKQRLVATPYGFGLNTDAFTDRQWSILAALGLSKGSRKLYS